MAMNNHRGTRAVCGLILAGTTVVLLVWSWGKWPDVIVDFGRELYVAWQIACGKTLYADIAYFNGPFSPYFNGLCFRLFGIGLSTLVVCNAVFLAALVWMLYRLLEEISDPVTAATACFVFLTVFAFGQYLGIGNYNFICPYSHEMTHGVTLGVAAIMSFGQYVRRGRTVFLVLAGFALGLVFLTKAELFLATAAALSTGMWLQRRVLQPRQWCAFFIAVAIPPLAALALLSTRMTFGEAWKGVLGSWPYVFNTHLITSRSYANWMGTLDVGTSLRKLFGALGWQVLVLGPVAGLAYLLRGQHARANWIPAAAFGAMIIALVMNWSPAGWLESVRPLPLLVLAACVATAVRTAKRGGANHPALIARWMFLVFSLMLMAKVALNARVAHYGFVLVMPAAVLWIAVLLSWIPSWISNSGGNGRVFRAAVFAVVVAAVASHLYVTNHWYARKSVAVGRGGDAFKTDRRGQIVNLALASIAQRVGPSETFAVFPEGAMLNYLSRRRNPTPYVNFMPPELLMFDEDRILAAYRRSPPDYVALVHRDSSEYGARFFGRDYGRRLSDWVAGSYEPVEQFGEVPLQDERFGVLLLKRRDAR